MARAGGLRLGRGIVGFQLSQWSDQWDRFIKSVMLGWDAMQARPHGLVGAVWDGIDWLSDWVLHHMPLYLGVSLAAVAVITLRAVRRRR
jgi:hypothetical protein